MDLALVFYERMTALDAIGPYDVLSRLPGMRVTTVGLEPGTVRVDNGRLGLVVDAALEDLPQPDVIVVPGGNGNRSLLTDERLLSWLRTAHATSTWTTSVCTGSLLLAAAGLLDGVEASTHWLAAELLERYGATYVPERVVERGRIITAAGVSAGIDMALTLAARLADATVSQAIQLGIEYDPQPPFDAGSEAKAPAHVVSLVRQMAATEAI